MIKRTSKYGTIVDIQGVDQFIKFQDGHTVVLKSLDRVAGGRIGERVIVEEVTTASGIVHLGKKI